MNTIISEGPWLVVIKGGMYAGKSERLIWRLRRREISGQKVILFKPKLDTRYSLEAVVTHSNISMDATAVDERKPEEILKVITTDVECVAIDEAQFFVGLTSVVKELLELNLIVEMSGLSLNFMNQPFGDMPELLAMADEVETLYAVCDVCHKGIATRSQLLREGRPVTKADSDQIIGGKESYEARCPKCFVHE